MYRPPLFWSGTHSTTTTTTTTTEPFPIPFFSCQQHPPPPLQLLLLNPFPPLFFLVRNDDDDDVYPRETPPHIRTARASPQRHTAAGTAPTTTTPTTTDPFPECTAHASHATRYESRAPASDAGNTKYRYRVRVLHLNLDPFV